LRFVFDFGANAQAPVAFTRPDAIDYIAHDLAYCYDSGCEYLRGAECEPVGLVSQINRNFLNSRIMLLPFSQMHRGEESGLARNPITGWPGPFRS
jgi:hypothetical protein